MASSRWDRDQKTLLCAGSLMTLTLRGSFGQARAPAACRHNREDIRSTVIGLRRQFGFCVFAGASIRRQAVTTLDPRSSPDGTWPSCRRVFGCPPCQSGFPVRVNWPGRHWGIRRFGPKRIRVHQGELSLRMGRSGPPVSRQARKPDPILAFPFRRCKLEKPVGKNGFNAPQDWRASGTGSNTPK
jgi:hypothetical protein